MKQLIQMANLFAWNWNTQNVIDLDWPFYKQEVIDLNAPICLRGIGLDRNSLKERALYVYMKLKNIQEEIDSSKSWLFAWNSNRQEATNSNEPVYLHEIAIYYK